MRSLRPQRPVGRPTPRPLLLALGFAGLAAALLALYVSFTATDQIPGRSYYNLRAEFDNADNLANHSQVRVAGRLVGQVLDPRVEEGLAVVDLQLADDLEPLRSDTTLRVRPRSVLGVRYVDLSPGRSGRPLGEGETIPASRTSAAVDPDEALEVFDPRTRGGTRTALRELGTAAADRGDELRDALAAAPQLLNDIDASIAAIRRKPGSLRRFFEGAHSIVAAAEPVRDSIAEGFEPEARALRPFSAHGRSLEATLEEAPATLRALDRTLSRVDPLVVELGALARRATGTLGAAPRPLEETAALLREARPALRRAPPTLLEAERATPPVVTALGRLHPVLPLLDSVLADSEPILEELAPRRCDIFAAFGNFADVMSFGNRAGNVLRFSFVGPSFEHLGIGTPPGSPTPGFHANPYPAPCEAVTDRVGR